MFQSCSKEDDFEIATYSGLIYLYEGPEIERNAAIDSVYLKPFSGITVFIHSLQQKTSWLGSYTRRDELQESGTSDETGKYSIEFAAKDYLDYESHIKSQDGYEIRRDYTAPESNNLFIFVPRSLIK